ncbi:MAG: U32 family peptidase, partial [Tyzzerella sp.]|nr:U32 family peptidase [Tyzzerella sp.]
GEMAADYNLYTWNEWSRQFWKQMGLVWDTVPLELNYQELKKRKLHGSEMVVYGYLPIMVSAQCQTKNHLGCTGKEKTLYLKDRKQKQFPVTNRCSFCYNIIYNSTALELADNFDEIVGMKPRCVRLQFTMEDAKETAQIISDYADVFLNGKRSIRNMKEFTRGHFKRGVE